MKNPLADQLAHPRGVLAPLAGTYMALRNRARSRWALQRLAAGEGEKILEIGFGPGADLARIAAAVGRRGFVGGVEISPPMLRMASRRNRRYIREGRVILQLGNATGLPYPEQVFHAVYCVGSANLWPDLGRGVSEIGRVLRNRGRAVLVVEPEPDEVDHWQALLAEQLRLAGFLDVTSEVGPGRPWVLAAGQVR